MHFWDRLIFLLCKFHTANWPLEKSLVDSVLELSDAKKPKGLR